MPLSPFLIMANSTKGINSMATISDTISEMVIVQGKNCRKSRNCPVMVKSRGKKIMLMQSVASRIDQKKSFALCTAAFHREIPLSSFSR